MSGEGYCFRSWPIVMERGLVLGKRFISVEKRVAVVV